MDQGEQQVIAALDSAGSPVDAAVRRQSELQLAEWANKPWFHSTVQNIYLNPSYSLQVRWLAIIYLKNSVQSHWRRTSANSVQPEEKALIRSKAFDCITEPNKKLNAQNAAAIGKIARVDFSKDWQNIFEQFNTCVLEKYHYDSQDYSQEQLLALYNGLDILDQVLKSLATAKYGNVRALLHKHAPPLIPKISHIYIVLVSQWTRDFDLAKMEVGYKALKIVTRLIYDDVEYPNRNPDAQQLFVTLKDHLAGFIQEYEKDTDVSELLFKHMKRIGKFYLRLLENEPVAFMLMNQSIDVFHLYLTVIESKANQITDPGDLSVLTAGSFNAGSAEFEDNDDEDDEDDKTEARNVWTKIVIQGFSMLCSVLQMIKRKGVNSIKSRTDEDRREAAECAELATKSLFTPEVTQRLTLLILNNYFRIVSEDVKHWRREPEEFFLEENEHESWQYQLRPCATRLFGFLIGCFDLASEIMAFVDNALKNDTRNIAIQDSALHALEHSGVSLSQKGVSLNDLMLQLLQMKYIDNVVIRRRLCAIISEWISLDLLDANVKKAIYETLVGDFLNPEKAADSDVVVLLTAAQALRYSVDEYQFNAELFAPCIDQAFKGLFALIGRLKMIECKVTVVHVMNVLIEQLKTHIAPYAGTVLQILPPLWEESQDKHHIKGLVLQTLLSMTQALRTQSVICHSIAIPLIRVSCDPSSPEYAFILEDGLPLWDALLENSESLSPELFSLIELLYKNLQQPTEVIVQHFEIANKYIVLSQPSEEFAREFSGNALPIIAGYLSMLKSEAFTSAVCMLELLAECYPLESYGGALLSTGIFEQLKTHLLDENVSSVLSSLRVLNFFSRMAIQNPTQFWSLAGDDQAREKLIEVWLKKFDNIGHPKDMKLNALGLTAVLSTCDPTILPKLKSFIDIWCDLLDQVNEEDANQSDSQLYYTNEELYEESQPDYELTLHQKRMIAIRKQRDPVHCLSLRRSVQMTVSLEPIKNGISQLPEDIIVLVQQLIKGT